MCNDCEIYTEAADRNFGGCALTPTAKTSLAVFVVNHSCHRVEIISEYDERFDSYWQYKKWTKENIDEMGISNN
jgi:hypothetical protein